jgi:hypothetical protein
MDILRNLQGEGQNDETQAISIQLALEKIEQRIKMERGTDKDRPEFSTGVERELNTIKDGIIAEAVKLAERVSARAAKRATDSPAAAQKLFDEFNDLNLKTKDPVKGSSAVVLNIAAQTPYTDNGETSTSSARREDPEVKDKQKVAAGNENEKSSSDLAHDHHYPRSGSVPLAWGSSCTTISQNSPVGKNTAMSVSQPCFDEQLRKNPNIPLDAVVSLFHLNLPLSF